MTPREVVGPSPDSSVAGRSLLLLRVVTGQDWALVVVIAAAAGFVVLLGVLVLLDWLGLFGRDRWD